MENIVFYFSGTGNCLYAARTIARELGGGPLVSMAKAGSYALTKQYDTVGFVFPTYFFGLPKVVADFIESLAVQNNEHSYYYAVATCGGFTGNALCQLYELFFKKHGIKLHYTQKLRMFSNYINMYEMSEKVDAITKQSNARLAALIQALKNRKTKRINKATKVFKFMNTRFVKNVATMDKDYTVNDNCTGCGICKTVCPVQNIELADNKPRFNHRCEQCVACIQYCPQKAINYKNQTQTRRRYTNPAISYTELAAGKNA